MPSNYFIVKKRLCLPEWGVKISGTSDMPFLWVAGAGEKSKGAWQFLEANEKTKRLKRFIILVIRLKSNHLEKFWKIAIILLQKSPEGLKSW